MRSAHKIGVVAIGRNEGDRLKRSLASLETWSASTVYVDSGSTDDSVAFARSRGVHVIELDTTTPFTAGRARNAGFERLLAVVPDAEFVQFVDGDCEVSSGWIERAAEELARDERIGVTCGRRRERHPNATLWNRLCDMEWNTPIGQARACGGDALYRVGAFKSAGGFDPRLVAGEEPELCVRLRARGFEIERIDADMTLHDVAMTRFSQWWRRASRNGHAIVGALIIHGSGADHDWGRQLFRAVFWPTLIMLAVIGASIAAFLPIATPLKLCAAALPIALWAVIFARTFFNRRARGDGTGDCARYAFFTVLGKWAECVGAFQCWRDHKSGRHSHWIEYKPVPARPSGERA